MRTVIRRFLSVTGALFFMAMPFYFARPIILSAIQTPTKVEWLKVAEISLFAALAIFFALSRVATVWKETGMKKIPGSNDFEPVPRRSLYQRITSFNFIANVLTGIATGFILVQLWSFTAPQQYTSKLWLPEKYQIIQTDKINVENIVKERFGKSADGVWYWPWSNLPGDQKIVFKQYREVFPTGEHFIFWTPKGHLYYFTQRGDWVYMTRSSFSPDPDQGNWPLTQGKRTITFDKQLAGEFDVNRDRRWFSLVGYSILTLLVSALIIRVAMGIVVLIIDL